MGFPVVSGNFALSDRDDEPSESLAQKSEPEPSWYGNEDSDDKKKGSGKELTKAERADLQHEAVDKAAV